MISCMKKIIFSKTRCCFSHLALMSLRIAILYLYKSYAITFNSARFENDIKIDFFDFVR
jgi:hypothetical protein